MYLLTRDDGVELRVSGSLWEATLELAFLYGWRPAGTQPPPTEAWRAAAGIGGFDRRGWDRQDYFSNSSQHVEREDARAVAAAVARALREVSSTPEVSSVVVSPRVPRTVGGSPLPSRATAADEGLSERHREGMRRLAAFADRGGFTIAAPD